MSKVNKLINNHPDEAFGVLATIVIVINEAIKVEPSILKKFRKK